MVYRWGTRQETIKRSPVRRQRAILEVEVLEGRACPSTLAAAPQITSFTATALSGHQVLLSGTVAGSAPAAAVVNFVGAATGSVTPDATGHFQMVATVAQLGTVFATAAVPDGGVSNTAPAAVNDPGIALRISAAQGPNRWATVTGQVSCNSPAGLTVTLSGAVSGSVTTSADGTFVFTAPASALGQIQATVTDVWGVSAGSSATLINAPPTIVNFRAINNGNNIWTFTGQVQDEYAAGLVVRLAGLPTLDNTTVTVQAGGTFSYTIMLQPGEGGGVSAQCTDWWGQTSNLALFYVLS